MRKFTVIISAAALISILSSCTGAREVRYNSANIISIESFESSVSGNEETTINEKSPIVVYIRNDYGVETTLIGGSTNGSFKSIYDYRYNDKELQEIYTLNYEQSEVDCELLKHNDTLVFYDKNAYSYNAICDYVELGFAHSTPHLIPNFKNEIQISTDIAIGISCNWDVFPRMPVFDGNTAVVDIDGNGVLDEIRWEFIDGEETEVAETKLIINYNGKEYVRQITSPIYIRDYTILNIMDLNGDGKMEIVEYTYDYGIEYVILGISEEGFTEYISYGYGDY
ncbi:MAG: hypothetical protein CVU97_05270 [Firmicutes bacterium HGW-Firmicutes-21]|nr:MAG: hypothetical protein CVU97_05270 [Firmicutes bacterium HGW-Firmicutes-21]